MCHLNAATLEHEHHQLVEDGGAQLRLCAGKIYVVSFCIRKTRLNAGDLRETSE